MYTYICMYTCIFTYIDIYINVYVYRLRMKKSKRVVKMFDTNEMSPKIRASGINFDTLLYLISRPVPSRLK